MGSPPPASLAARADAIASGREHRRDLPPMPHAVGVLEAILRSGETGCHERRATLCTRMKEAVSA